MFFAKPDPERDNTAWIVLGHEKQWKRAKAPGRPEVIRKVNKSGRSEPQGSFGND